jgi:uncharacterized membrane protein
MSTAPESRHEAQRRADRIRTLSAGLADLEAEEVLTLSAEQRASFNAWCQRSLAELAARFDIDTSTSQRRMSWGMRIASTLGGLAFCVSVWLFFMRYLGLLDTGMQVGILVVLPLVALVATEWVARRGEDYFTGLLALVALACFIMNLSVLGLIFNMVASPSAMLAWGVFAMLLAYRYEQRALLVPGLGLLLAWSSGQVMELGDENWQSFTERPEILAVASLLVFAIPLKIPHRRCGDFPPVYRLAGALVFFLAILTLAVEGHFSYLNLETKNVERVYEAVGLAASAGAVWLGVRRQWDGLVNTAAVAFASMLFLRLQRAFWGWLPHYLFFALVGVLAILLVLAFRKLRMRSKTEAAR